MSSASQTRAEVQRFLAHAKAELSDQGSFRLRVLLDMIALELASLERLELRTGKASSAVPPGEDGPRDEGV